MPEVVHSAEIYASELSRYGHGRPMWSPDVPESGIQLGDVGVILKRKGSFKPFFNVFSDTLPDGFEPLDLDGCLYEYHESYLSRVPLCSKHIKVQAGEVSAGAGAAAASAGINMTFSWTSKAGALLQMTDEADLFSILSNKKCLRYIDAHYDSWCDFITDKGLDLDAEDIEGPVLVRGMIKTSGWGLSAWSSTSSSHALKVEGGDPGIASAGLSFKFDDAVGSAPEFRSGPKRLNQQGQYPRDQAVFLTVYKVRWKDTCIRNIISVGAGSQERTYLPLLDRNRSQRGGGASSSGSTSPPGLGGGHQGISRSGGQKYADPVDKLLEYILARSETERAIACEADVRELCGPGELPEDVMSEFERLAPRIDIIGRNTGVISIDETIYKSHTPGTQGEGMGIPFAAPQYTYSSKGLTVTGEQGDIQTGALTVGKTAEERNTIRWPHVVFTERGAETGAPCTPTISQDGQLLAAGYEDTFVRLFDLTKECLVSLFSGHDEAVRCAKFSPDNKLLATGSVDTTIIVWNVEDGRQVKRLQGHDADVWTLAISPDGEDIVSGSADTAVKFWKLKGESETEFAQVSGHPATVEAVTYTPDSSRVLACSGEVGYIYSRAGKAFATMTGHQGIIYSLETSHRGDRVITGSEDHTARIWLIETGVELVTIRQHHEPVWSAHFSMDDTTVLCGSYDTTVSIHDSYTGELHFILQSNTSFVESVAYFPRGDLVASGAADGLVMLWEASTGEKVAELKCHVDKVTSIQFSPGGENLVTSSEDGTIRLLNVVDVLRVC